jgi:anaerobic magnesium-protoporphyrin IX monomethyl ester cyclase
VRVLILNSPWINTATEYGIKSGTRWAALRKRERTMPYMPYPYHMAQATAVLKQAGIDAWVKDAVNEGMGEAAALDHVAGLKPDLLLIEPYTPSVYVDLAFAQKAKERAGCRIAVCGAHATALPEDMLAEPAIDFVLLGEYDYTLRDLARALAGPRTELAAIEGLGWKDGTAVRLNPRRPPIADIDELPFPDFGQLPPRNYNEPLSRSFPHAKIITSRGCPYHCSFCTVPLLAGPRYRTHSLPYLIRLVRHLVETQGVKELYFDDDILTIERAKAIAQALLDADLHLPWSCWMHWNVSRDDLALLKKSGCFAIKVGIESADPEVRKQADKSRVEIPNIRRLIKDCHALHLLIHGSFMLGLPGDTKASLRRTVDLAFSLGLDACQFSIATPLPGTPLYRMAKEHGWLTTEDWSQFEGLESCVVSYPECSREDILAAMALVRTRKVRQFFRDPAKAARYLWKFYRMKGWRALFAAVAEKGAFALKALAGKK